jgi:Ser/Thr protein kinase RdoA (MazF antagonist)
MIQALATGYSTWRWRWTPVEITQPAYTRYREALLNGYAEFRTLPEQQAEQIELFLAGIQVYSNLWVTGGIHLYPDLLPEYRERIARTADFVVHYARQKDRVV